MRRESGNRYERGTLTEKIAAALGKLLATGKARFDKQKLNGPGRAKEMWFAV